MRNAMLVDHSKCIACEACTVVCRELNEVPGQVQYTRITRIRGGDYPAVYTHNLKSACMHCEEATCTLVCPSGAMHKTEYGVSVDSSRCIGCNYCAANCPFSTPQFERGSNQMLKCTFCASRQAADKPPYCAEVCPTGAISFGPRAEMLARAHQRVAALAANGFPNAQVYGATQLGGLGVLTVLKADPGVYGLPADPKIPAGTIIWRYLTRPFGGVAVAAAAVVMAFNWAVTRRNRAIDSREVGT